MPKETPQVKAAKKTQVERHERNKRSVEGELPEGTRFPEHLPREEEVIDEGKGEVVFEKVTERLTARTSTFYVKRIVRRVRKSEGSLVSPAVHPAVIERTSADVSFLAYLLVAKYVWHLPIYRREQRRRLSSILLQLHAGSLRLTPLSISLMSLNASQSIQPLR